ncbi:MULTISPECIES: hypothetical protein [Streptomyces]|uniref:Uncharacterized protein n=1 Tax=Streptomyces ehimensis TaxID=68195 RepID=A0ABV9BQU6_9ACTN
MRRFILPWGELSVFGDESLPDALWYTAETLRRLETRFRPALLRFGRWRTEAPYVAVWPTDRVLPDLAGNAEALQDHEMNGVVLAEIHTLTCQVCGARFQVVYPEGALPFFGDYFAAHRRIHGCLICHSDFSASRIQALALLPLPQ